MVSTEHVSIVIRITPELHEQLRQRSADEERSMAGTVRIALRRYLAATEPPIVPPAV